MQSLLRPLIRDNLPEGKSAWAFDMKLNAGRTLSGSRCYQQSSRTSSFACTAGSEVDSAHASLDHLLDLVQMLDDGERLFVQLGLISGTSICKRRD